MPGGRLFHMTGIQNISSANTVVKNEIHKFIMQRYLP